MRIREEALAQHKASEMASAVMNSSRGHGTESSGAGRSRASTRHLSVLEMHKYLWEQNRTGGTTWSRTMKEGGPPPHVVMYELAARADAETRVVNDGQNQIRLVFKGFT